MPTQPNHSLERAKKHLQKGNLQAAIQEYRRAAEEAPEDVSIHNALGDLYVRAHDVREAIRCFQYAGEVYKQQDLHLKAIAVYRKVCELDPVDHESALTLGQLLARAGRQEDAQRVLLRVVDSLRKAGMHQAVVYVLGRCSEADPKTFEVALVTAEELLGQGALTEALQTVLIGLRAPRRGFATRVRELLLRMEPSVGDVPALRLELARAFLRADLPVDAARTAVTLPPGVRGRVELLLEVAHRLVQQGEAADARVLVEACWGNLDPSDAPRAVAVLEAIHTELPDDPVTLGMLRALGVTPSPPGIPEEALPTLEPLVEQPLPAEPVTTEAGVPHSPAREPVWDLRHAPGSAGHGDPTARPIHAPAHETLLDPDALAQPPPPDEEQHVDPAPAVEAPSVVAVEVEECAFQGLIGLHQLEWYLDIEWRRAARRGTSLSVLVAEIDGLNPEATGVDEREPFVAAALRAVLKRPGDILARRGRGVFLAVLPETPVEGARVVAEGMRAGVEALTPEENGMPACATVSIGVASASPRASGHGGMLVQAADEALLETHFQGGNCANVAPVLTFPTSSSRLART
ncbi:MAG: diguanylate cyclase [Myxococcota bacterium]